MRTHTHRLVVTLVSFAAVTLVAGACKGGGSTGGVTHKNDPNSLKEVWSTLVAAAKADDTDKAVAIAKGLIADEASLKVALRDGVDPAILAGLKKQAERMKSAKAEDIKKGFKPERTEVKVHGATPKEIIEQKTPASKEFPGGAKRAAESVLKEGVTFYEVELLEPGKELGTKMHLMFFDGSQWRMLGPVWRHMPRK